MLIEIINGISHIYCEKCNYKIRQTGFGFEDGIVCPKCHHKNIMLDDPDFFPKLFKKIPNKMYSKKYLAGIDKDKFYASLNKILNTNKVFKHDVYDLSQNPQNPEYNYLAVYLIED